MNFVYTHDQNKSLLRNSELRFQFSVAITITRFKLKQKLYKTISTSGSATMHCYTPHFETVRNTVKNAVNISFDVKLFFFQQNLFEQLLISRHYFTNWKSAKSESKKACTCCNLLKRACAQTHTYIHAHTHTRTHIHVHTHARTHIKTCMEEPAKLRALTMLRLK